MPFCFLYIINFKEIKIYKDDENVDLWKVPFATRHKSAPLWLDRIYSLNKPRPTVKHPKKLAFKTGDEM